MYSKQEHRDKTQRYSRVSRRMFHEWSLFRRSFLHEVPYLSMTEKMGDSGVFLKLSMHQRLEENNRKEIKLRWNTHPEHLKNELDALASIYLSRKHSTVHFRPPVSWPLWSLKWSQLLQKGQKLHKSKI